MNFLIKKYPCSQPKRWAPVKGQQVQLGPDKTSQKICQPIYDIFSQYARANDDGRAVLTKDEESMKVV